VLVGAATTFSEEAGGMAVIEVDDGAVLLGEGMDAGEVGDGAVHGEDAIGGDHDVASFGFGGCFELGFEVGEVVVGVAVALGFTEADAIDDGGVI